MNYFTNLFSKKQNASVLEQKHSGYATTFSLTTGDTQARWNKNDYHTLCQEGYRKNPIVYSCIRMTADGAARIPLKIYRDGKIDPAHPINNLLNTPNPWQSGFALRSDLFGFLQIAGNGYLDIVCGGDNTTLPAALPCELYALRPDRITLSTDIMGRIDAYIYKPSPQKKPLMLNNKRILHLKYFSPDDDYYGQPPLMAAMRANDTHNKAGDFQKSLLDNAARPSGCLVYNGTNGSPNLTAEQFARIKSELQDTYTGTAAAGRPMVLEGGLEWKSMSFSPADMEFSQLRHNAARDIALAFGVPPMLLGIQGDNTYSNYQEANRVFTRNTLLPICEMFCEGISRKLSVLYQQNIDIKPDTDNLPAFLPEKESKRNFIATATFLSDEEKYNLLF